MMKITVQPCMVFYGVFKDYPSVELKLTSVQWSYNQGLMKVSFAMRIKHKLA